MNIMIKFNLTCRNCKHSFDSWFSSSKEFEKLKNKKLIICYNCNSIDIDKSIMAPNLKNTKKKNITKLTEIKKIKKQLIKNQEYIKKNFEYVGDKFAYEARLIHYSKKNKKKGIYGSANLRDIKELKEEGIKTEIIPWIKKNN